MTLKVEIKDGTRPMCFPEETSVPTLLEGGANDWPAVKKWSLEYFVENFPKAIVPLAFYENGAYQSAKDRDFVELKHYIDFITGKRQPCKIINIGKYLAGWVYSRDKEASRLVDDIKVPESFKDNLFPEISRSVVDMPYTSMFIGHPAVSSPLHTDSYYVATYLTGVTGTKIVRLARPDVDNKVLKNGIDIFKPDTEFLLKESGVKIFEAKIEPGDILYIPPGFWHQAVNSNLTIAISTNYVNLSNFIAFEQQLRTFLLKPFIKISDMRHRIFESEPVSHVTDTELMKNCRFVDNERQFLEFIKSYMSKSEDIVDCISKNQNHKIL